jgi:hypothetical protein
VLTARPCTRALDLTRPTLNVGGIVSQTTIKANLLGNCDGQKYDSYR